MPLIDILTDTETYKGKVTDASRPLRIYKINKAAREIHKGSDIEESMDEQVFNINVSSQQVALPSYIDKVRGMRYYDGRSSINLDDMRNRYNFNFTGENELWYLQWRKLKPRCLSREISNQSVIKVTVPLEEPEAFTVTITGKTDKSERISEVLSFSTTDLEQVTAANFIAVESVVKSRVTKYNVSLYDVEDNLLGEVLNSENQSTYQIYQIADTDGFSMPANVSGVEVRYKYKFQPFLNDGDTFFGMDAYDDAIVWKFMEHESQNVTDALAYRGKCKEILEQLATDTQAGQRTKINFKPNPFLNLPYSYAGGLTRYH